MPKTVTLRDVLPLPSGAPRGSANGAAKLDADDVRAIRKFRAEGAAINRLALAFDVSRSTVRRIVLRQTWADVR